MFTGWWGLASSLMSRRVVAQLAFCGLLFVSRAQAMVELDDEAMTGVSGAGIAIELVDYRFMMEPTGYLEQIGTEPDPLETSFRRGDLRWFGLAVSGVAGGTSWTEAACPSSGYNGLGCPRGGPIARFSAHDNPYVIRAFEYNAIGFNGVLEDKTVLEILAPTAQDPYRFAFWGEIGVDRDGLLGAPGLLKSQTLIQGNAAGSILRFFSSTDPQDISRQTFGLFYHSHMQGDFRFSVQQQVGVASDTSGVPVMFQADEGMHFRNVEAFIPLGQLNYQALTLSSVVDGGGNVIQDGNFVLELNRVPEAASSDFYGFAPGDIQGYSTALNALRGSGTQPSSSYFTTHGYSRWGDWFPDCGTAACLAAANAAGTRNVRGTTDSGIFFRTLGSFNASAQRRLGFAPFGSVTTYGLQASYSAPVTNGVANIGDARIEGLAIQRFKITSLGADQ